MPRFNPRRLLALAAVALAAGTLGGCVAYPAPGYYRPVYGYGYPAYYARPVVGVRYW